jgi:hypothetical protein
MDSGLQATSKRKEKAMATRLTRSERRGEVGGLGIDGGWRRWRTAERREGSACEGEERGEWGR